MHEYLEENKKFWEHGYYAPNVDHPVFRFYGRILKPVFKLNGEGGEFLLDYGCGQGAAVNYFSSLGFDAYGVDISETDLGIASERYQQIGGKFREVSLIPSATEKFFDGDFRIITAIQSLYYLSDTDLKVRMESIHANLAEGGIFFATMIGESGGRHFDKSKPAGDGLRKVGTSSRSGEGHHYVNFTKDEDHLCDKFEMFKPLHIGFYSDQFRSDEGVSIHHTFVGVKK